MEVPFSGFELTFIILAFVIFSLFSLASVCIRPEEAGAGKHDLPQPKSTTAKVNRSDARFDFTISEDAPYEGKKVHQKVNKKQKEITKPAGQKV
uniref:Uncharacterized protein n=1 Tax=Fundulus heteroclitus TaxID=8078 RepID=A0A3Q2P8I4_FUNHE